MIITCLHVIYTYNYCVRHISHFHDNFHLHSIKSIYFDKSCFLQIKYFFTNDIWQENCGSNLRSLTHSRLSYMSESTTFVNGLYLSFSKVINGQKMWRYSNLILLRLIFHIQSNVCDQKAVYSYKCRSNVSYNNKNYQYLFKRSNC